MLDLSGLFYCDWIQLFGWCKLPDDVLEDSSEPEAELLVEAPDHGGWADIPEQH